MTTKPKRPSQSTPTSPPDPPVWQPWGGAGVLEHHGSFPSTMDRARELAPFATPTSPVTVLADEQTAGRGTRGRAWHSPLGGLWMTTAFTVPPAPHTAPLVGIAILNELVELTADGLPIGYSLKWPNDILIGQQKAAGILIESAHTPSGPVTLVGIGINLNAHPEPTPMPAHMPAPSSDIAAASSALSAHRTPTPFTPTSIARHTGKTYDVRHTAERISRAVTSALHGSSAERTPSQIPEADLQAINAYLFRARVETEHGSARIEAVEPDGALLLRTDAGKQQRHLTGTLRFTL